MGAREVMEAALPEPARIDRGERGRPIAPPLPLPRRRPPPRSLAALARARRPLVVTSYLGRRPPAVRELVRFCRARWGAGVLESVPVGDELPRTTIRSTRAASGTSRGRTRRLAAADVVLVIDSDVPWIPTVSRPAADAAIFHIDVDPLKEGMPLWYIGARRSLRADAATALGQLNAVARRPADRRSALARAHRALCRRQRRRARAELRRARDRRGRRHHPGVPRRLRPARTSTTTRSS